MNHAALAGDLNFISLGDILQLLGSNGSTGVLRITSKYAQEPGLIYCVKGNPVDASNGSVGGLDALYSLFGWTEGKFEFIQEKVEKEKVIKKSRMELILDGLSMLDDGVIEKLGPVSFEKKVSDSSGIETTSALIKGPLVDYMYVVDEEGFSDGRIIAEEGKHGRWIWVILEGVVEIVKETSQGPLKLHRLGTGAFIGSVASFLMGNYVRSASVVAIGNVQLGVLDSQRLAAEFNQMSPEFRDLLAGFDKRLKKVTDRALGINLNNNRLEELIKNNKPLIKQGQDDENIYKITRGEAYVVRYTDDGPLPLIDLCQGDYLGRVPFIDMSLEPYSASVFGSGELQIETVDPQSFQQEYDRLSACFKNIIEHVANCISVTTTLTCRLRSKTDKKKTKKG